MKTIKQELPYLAIALLPTLYLLFVWDSIPDSVPIHWNSKGEADGFGDAYSLLYACLFIPGIIYVIMYFLPNMDPKGKIQTKTKKFKRLRIILQVFMSTIAFYVVFSALNPGKTSINHLFIILGALFAVLGNYFQTIPPNYFIGIKTAWTLDNEEVWKKTHRLGGKLWLIGGLGCIISALIIPVDSLAIVFMSITAIIVIIPVFYSYLEYKKVKTN
jgi:uncharacterized membrane protein